MKIALAISSFIILTLTGCELFVIGTKQRAPVINLNQESGIGSVYLFKTELDSNNIQNAIYLLSKPNGASYLAIEKYELADELSRLRRIIGKKPITFSRTDTLSDKQLKVKIEFDYFKAYTFSTEKIKDKWYITEYSEIASGK